MEKSLKINIHDYEIIKKLNEGGYGIVYSVKHKKTNEEFAAKILKNLNSDEEQDRQVVNNEVRILKRFQHPTIIRFYGISNKDFHGNDNYTLLFELFKNGSLEDILKKSKRGVHNPLYDNTAKQIILIGISRGMMLLHQNRVIHRDLKPGNVLIGDDLRPHITDFGTANSFEKYEAVMTNSGDQGTPLYMSPEAIKNESITAKSDVYSFGILMFEVLTNRDPFPNYRKMGRYNFNRNIVSGELKPEFNAIEPIKNSLKNLVNRCIEYFPDRRPTFNEIYSMLAYGKDPVLGDIEDDDQKYFLDDVDVDEIKEYIEIIKEDIVDADFVSPKTVDKLVKKVDKMGQQMNDLKEENRRLKESQEGSQMLIVDSEKVLALEKKFAEYQQRMDNVIDQIEETTRRKLLTMEERFQIVMSSLESVVIPETITEIPDEAFINCKNLKKVKIPSSVLSIGYCAFAGCSQLAEVEIPNSVTIIGKYAFNECQALTKVTIPASVTKIERAAFRNCTSLKEVVISAKTKIETGAFCGCSSLKKKPVRK